MSEILRATHQGKLFIGEIELPCFVLENGQRVFSGRKLQTALTINSTGGQKLNSFLLKNDLKPFITEEIWSAINNPIKFKSGRLVGFGYEAVILNKICSALLSYRRNIFKQGLHLSTSENRIIDRAELLQSGFAEVGIIALVDEATGYQLEREKDELQKILAAYISKELLPWQKKFPDEFYIQIFRLKKWQSDPIKERSPFVGKITNDVIYNLLPMGILEELKSKNPFDEETKQRKFKHHQFLTPEIGNKHLEKQLTEVITLMRISENWDEFEGSMFKAFSNFGKGQTIPLGFE